MAELFHNEPPQKCYWDRRHFSSFEDYTYALRGTTTVYVGNLSFYTSETQIKELFSKVGPVKRVIMGLDRFKKTPCGFCFVEYYSHQDCLASINFVDGTSLDDRIIRVDIDFGWRQGRQYGRGSSGGQVRDERRWTYDPARGGLGKQAERQVKIEARYRGYQWEPSSGSKRKSSEVYDDDTNNPEDDEREPKSAKLTNEAAEDGRGDEVEKLMDDSVAVTSTHDKEPTKSNEETVIAMVDEEKSEGITATNQPTQPLNGSAVDEEKIEKERDANQLMQPPKNPSNDSAMDEEKSEKEIDTNQVMQPSKLPNDPSGAQVEHNKEASTSPPIEKVAEPSAERIQQNVDMDQSGS